MGNADSTAGNRKMPGSISSTPKFPKVPPKLVSLSSIEANETCLTITDDVIAIGFSDGSVCVSQLTPKLASYVHASNNNNNTLLRKILDDGDLPFYHIISAPNLSQHIESHPHLINNPQLRDEVLSQTRKLYPSVSLGTYAQDVLRVFIIGHPDTSSYIPFRVVVVYSYSFAVYNLDSILPFDYYQIGAFPQISEHASTLPLITTSCIVNTIYDGSEKKPVSQSSSSSSQLSSQLSSSPSVTGRNAGSVPLSSVASSSPIHKATQKYLSSASDIRVTLFIGLTNGYIVMYNLLTCTLCEVMLPPPSDLFTTITGNICVSSLECIPRPRAFNGVMITYITYNDYARQYLLDDASDLHETDADVYESHTLIYNMDTCKSYQYTLQWESYVHEFLDDKLVEDIQWYITSTLPSTQYITHTGFCIYDNLQYPCIIVSTLTGDIKSLDISYNVNQLDHYTNVYLTGSYPIFITKDTTSISTDSTSTPNIEEFEQVDMDTCILDTSVLHDTCAALQVGEYNTHTTELIERMPDTLVHCNQCIHMLGCLASCNMSFLIRNQDVFKHEVAYLSHGSVSMSCPPELLVKYLVDRHLTQHHTCHYGLFSIHLHKLTLASAFFLQAFYKEVVDVFKDVVYGETRTQHIVHDIVNTNTNTTNTTSTTSTNTLGNLSNPSSTSTSTTSTTSDDPMDPMDELVDYEVAEQTEPLTTEALLALYSAQVNTSDTEHDANTLTDADTNNTDNTNTTDTTKTTDAITTTTTTSDISSCLSSSVKEAELDSAASSSVNPTVLQFDYTEVPSGEYMWIIYAQHMSAMDETHCFVIDYQDIGPECYSTRNVFTSPSGSSSTLSFSQHNTTASPISTKYTNNTKHTTTTTGTTTTTTGTSSTTSSTLTSPPSVKSPVSSTADFAEFLEDVPITKPEPPTKEEVNYREELLRGASSPSTSNNTKDKDKNKDKDKDKDKDKKELTDAKHTMQQNLRLAHENKEKMSEIGDKSERMARNAESFAEKCRKLREKQSRGGGFW